MYFSTFIERRCKRAEVLYPVYVSHLTGWHFSAGLASPFYLNFRVRFFISDPNSLQHEQTRLVHVLLCHECCCYVERLSDSERSFLQGLLVKMKTYWSVSIFFWHVLVHHQCLAQSKAKKINSCFCDAVPVQNGGQRSYSRASCSMRLHWSTAVLADV